VWTVVVPIVAFLLSTAAGADDLVVCTGNGVPADTSMVPHYVVGLAHGFAYAVENRGVVYYRNLVPGCAGTLAFVLPSTGPTRIYPDSVLVDEVPPCRVCNLWSWETTQTTIRLTWITPVDGIGNCGPTGHVRCGWSAACECCCGCCRRRAFAYDLRYTTGDELTEENFGNATPVTGLPPPRDPMDISWHRRQGDEMIVEGNLPELQPGVYQATATVYANDNRVLGRARQMFVRYDHGKDLPWLFQRVGDSTKVLPPWEPIRESQISDSGFRILSCWGREYCVDGS